MCNSHTVKLLLARLILFFLSLSFTFTCQAVQIGGNTKHSWDYITHDRLTLTVIQWWIVALNDGFTRYPRSGVRQRAENTLTDAFNHKRWLYGVNPDNPDDFECLAIELNPMCMNWGLGGDPRNYVIVVDDKDKRLQLPSGTWTQALGGDRTAGRGISNIFDSTTDSYITLHQRWFDADPNKIRFKNRNNKLVGNYAIRLKILAGLLAHYGTNAALGAALAAGIGAAVPPIQGAIESFAGGSNTTGLFSDEAIIAGALTGARWGAIGAGGVAALATIWRSYTLYANPVQLLWLAISGAGETTEGNIFLHEFGHTLGLRHPGEVLWDQQHYWGFGMIKDRLQLTTGYRYQGNLDAWNTMMGDGSEPSDLAFSPWLQKIREYKPNYRWDLITADKYGELCNRRQRNVPTAARTAVRLVLPVAHTTPLLFGEEC